MKKETNNELKGAHQNWQCCIVSIFLSWTVVYTLYMCWKMHVNLAYLAYYMKEHTVRYCTDTHIIIFLLHFVVALAS